jgi:hypothetical protein
MRAHPAHVDVQRLGCGALTNLACANTANQTAIVSAGGVEAVLGAMQAHPAHVDVLKNGCHALANLASANTANQTAIASAGGVEAVLGAMQAHPADANLLKETCCALMHFSRRHPSNQAAIVSAGGVEAVLRAMRSHPADLDVQRFCCGVLVNLVTGNVKRQAFVVAAGAVELTLGAMQAHPADVNLQEWGRFVLGCGLTNPSTLPRANSTTASVGGGASSQQSWSCSQCTFDNHVALSQCEMCNSARPTAAPAPAALLSPQQPVTPVMRSPPAKQHAFLDCAKARDWASVYAALAEDSSLLHATPANRWSVLHQAAATNDAKVVQELLQRGADPLLRNRDSRTPSEVTTSPEVKALLRAYSVWPGGGTMYAVSHITRVYSGLSTSSSAVGQLTPGMQVRYALPNPTNS